MQPASPVASSTKSKPAPKGSRESASQTAAAAFQSRPQSPKDNKGTEPTLEGRRRLSGAFLIEIEKLEADPEQPRRHFDETAIAELASSITERGVKQAVTVRWNPDSSRYRVIDGERRLRASRKAGLKEIPCLIEESTAQDILVDQIVSNWQRSDLRPYETAEALVKLKAEFKMTVSDLARATGKSKGEISKLIALVENVDAEVQALVRDVSDTLITKRHLYALTQLSPVEQRRLASRIQREHLTAVETERIIKSESAIELDAKERNRGRPRKHIRLETAWGAVTLSPISQDYDTALLHKMLHQARRKLSDEIQ